jgi:hypothetical protein
MNYHYTKDTVVSGSKKIRLFKRFIAYAKLMVLFLLHVCNRIVPYDIILNLNSVGTGDLTLRFRMINSLIDLYTLY